MSNENPIIPILDFHGQEGVRGVRAKALYLALYSDAGHYSRWADASITGNPAAIRGQDWVFATVAETSPQGGRPSIELDLSLEFAEHLAMMANSPKGREVRDYFRRCRDELRAKPSQDWAIPQTLPEALRLAAEAIEEKDRIAALRAQEAPLVAYAEKVQGSPTSYPVDTTAKELGIPVVKFREFVQGKFLFRRGRDWLPRAEYQSRGWFEVATRTYNHDGAEMTYHVTKVTGQGRIGLKAAWDRANAMAVA